MLPATHQHPSTPPRQRASCWLQVALALLLALGALAALPPAPTRAATLTVTNGNNSGPGSLRDTLYGAAAGDTVTFAPGVSTVTLTASELYIDRSVTIQGRGMGGVTVQRGAASGTPNFRVFNVLGGVAATLSGLTIRNGVDRETYAAGGGIFNDGNLTLINSMVSDNSVADFGLGGGIVNTGDLTLIDSTVSANSARYGGGIYMDTGNLTLMGSTISGNNGGVSGGGIYVYRGSASLTNSTISGNSAIYGGGLAKTGSGTLTLTGVTVSGNSASYGGGLNSSESAAVTRLRASIVAGNSAAVGADCGGDYTGNYPPTSLGDNVVGNGSGCPANGPGDLAYGGALAALLNPTLANNGGPTQTHALPLGSPALNRVPALRCSDIATDQRGVHRPQGGNCDSGAFELSHFTLTFSTVGPGTVRATTSGLPLGSTLPPTSSHPQGKIVALSATPAAGARFVGWTVNGKPAGATNPLSLTMSEHVNVVATFAPLR